MTADLDFTRFESAAQVQEYIRNTRSWGRWGTNDQVGSLNLLTPESRLRALRTVRNGHVISLSLPITTDPTPGSPRPAVLAMRRDSRIEGAGAASDYLFMGVHSSTHIDALSHVWDAEGLWGGVDPDEGIGLEGATWGSVHHWRDGVFARCVLFDVPKYRGIPWIQIDDPVTAEELEAMRRDMGIDLHLGDAIAVYTGRDEFLSSGQTLEPDHRPGLDVSCLKFLKNHDVSALVWDFQEAKPSRFDLPWGVHAAIYAYGCAILDRADLGPLARYCSKQGRVEFLLVVAPLVIVGGTGSPVNPLAIL